MLNRLPTVLLYHSVPRYGTAEDGMNATVFERQIVHLKRYFTFIRAEDYGQARGSRLRPPLLISFDDGLRNHAEVAAPILRRHGVPAVFFINSRHCHPGQYMWFTLLLMLGRYYRGEMNFNGTRIRFGSPEGRVFDRAAQALMAIDPHPEAMYAALADQMPCPLEELVSPTVLRDECEGMTPAQIRELAGDPLFTVGSHTCDHPFLPRCTLHEAERQIAENKQWLEAASGAACELFAYPHGAFTVPVAEICRRLGFRYAFSVERTERPVTDMSMPRVGVYKPSTAVLHFKVACGGLLYSKPVARLLSGLRASAAAASARLRPAPAANQREDGTASN